MINTIWSLLKSYTGTFGIALSNHNTLLTYEGRPNIQNNYKLNLYVTCIEQANYALMIKGRDLAMEGREAFPIDKHLSTKTKFVLDGNATQYHFSGTSVEASKGADRFKIIFKKSDVLPVTFTDITAREIRGDVKVNWGIATEEKMSHYEVEHSRTGTEFGKATKVDAKNTSPASYEWLHVQPGTGDHFYRVRAFNLEGRSLTTRIVKENIGSMGDPAFKVFPTIVSQTRNVTVQMTAMEKGSYTLQVTDMGGRVISAQTIEHAGGSASLILNLPPALSKGKYNVRLYGTSGNFVESVLQN